VSAATDSRNLYHATRDWVSRWFRPEPLRRIPISGGGVLVEAGSDAPLRGLSPRLVITDDVEEYDEYDPGPPYIEDEWR